MKKLKFALLFMCLLLCASCFKPSLAKAAKAKNIADVTPAPTGNAISTPKPEKNGASGKSKYRLNVSKLNMTKDSRYLLRIYNLKKKQSVTFSSSNTNIISFASRSSKKRRARLVANNVGTATITATVRKKNKKIVARVKCQVTVTPQAISIKFPKQELLLQIGTNYHIKPFIKPSTSKELPHYTSSDPSVATVNSKGKIKTRGLGTAVITARLLNGQTASLTVTVTEDEATDDPTQKPYINEKELYTEG